MIWRLVVLLHVLLLGAESSNRGGRTVTFHRTQQDDSQDRARARTRRETRPFHGPPFTSCRTPLTPVEHKVLDDNTHETGFNGDDGSYVILTWVGDGTGVVLVLSTFSAPIDSFIEGGSSRLYRSTDYAKSFHDISHQINNTFIREEFGVSVGPGSSVILTADIPVVYNRGGIIFISTDAGATFKFIQLPFHLAQPITYHFLNPDYLVALSIDGGLWLSLDFGAKWTKVHDGVHSFSWGAGINLFFSRSRTDAVEAEERGDLLLKRTTDLGKTFTTIHEDIFSFGYIGAFLFFSVMEDPRSPRVMYFSSDQGETFSRALLPSASTEQFYSILDGDVDMLFMHVDNPGDTFFGTMYTSDDRGILFSKSLERHLFDGQRKSDFTNITSLRGVYLTNKLDEDGRIRSVISFNRGGTWRHLNKPENVECGEQVKNCNIHIHGEHSRNIRIVPMLALSEPTAIGLVIAHGTVGDSLSSSQHPDVFVSSDGGYNWRGTLRGPHHYSILDSGGLIVAVEAQREGQVKTIKFSTDEGQCWKSYNFTEQPFFFAGLASEPGTKAMNVSVWGFRPEEDGQPMWVAVTIDFQSLITRECHEEDYEEWLAHATGGGDLKRNGCLLGVKETYRRLKKPSVCRNGRGFVVSKKQSPCLCTRADYLCDYGYDRHANTSECVRQRSAANKTLELCLNGEEDELLTAGYRKVPSDRCEGGFSPQLAVQTVIRPCGVKPSPGPPARSSSPVTHFDTPRERLVLILVCAGAGVIVLVVIVSAVFAVRRVVYRNRSPVYRFSNLRIQDEDNGTTADLESATSSNGTACLQESDDDLIE
ncbi:sortilin isoform X1 [Pseudoliparis swirei]|uniref:sortilin isoform X1 n=1 Tax=Pseudoliparis swirei TaxID=2059687 RepID=UPI0024BE7F73|nr:sortilin isoform X1 [Pseudoliparis swirei]XP_056281269.1 sortilin isoform X1 [Pseudoliparis swirei]XP_056281270.1 sortilin isoform X1 [Pseudoliparis swirei]